MARKKAVPVEEQEPSLEVQVPPEGETVTGEGEFQEGLLEAPNGESVPTENLPGVPCEEGSPTDGLPEDLGELGAPEGLPGPTGEEAEGLPSDTGDLPPDDAGDGEVIPGVPPDSLPEGGEAAVEVPEGPPGGEGSLRPLEVYSIKERLDAWVLDLLPDDKNVAEVLERGLADGSIVIPGGDPDQSDGFEAVTNVTSYLNTFGVTVADRIFVPTTTAAAGGTPPGPATRLWLQRK